MAIRDGHSRGVSWAFVGLWFTGEVLTLVYVLPKGHLPLIFNYLGNIMFAGIIIWYKVFPRTVKEI